MLPLTLLVPDIDPNVVFSVLDTFGTVDSAGSQTSTRLTWPGGLFRDHALPVRWVGAGSPAGQHVVADLVEDVSCWLDPAQAGAAAQRLQGAGAVVLFDDTLFELTGGDTRVNVVMALARALDGVICTPGFLFDARGRVLLDFDGDVHDDAVWPGAFASVGEVASVDQHA